MYNGDIGFVTDVEPGEGELTASFDGRSVTYGFGELDALVPAYAASIHKSQGSEYPAVVIPVMTQHYDMLQPNLLYTGVTRGKLGKSALVEAERVAAPLSSGPFSLRYEMEFIHGKTAPKARDTLLRLRAGKPRQKRLQNLCRVDDRPGKTPPPT